MSLVQCLNVCFCAHLKDMLGLLEKKIFFNIFANYSVVSFMQHFSNALYCIFMIFFSIGRIFCVLCGIIWLSEARRKTHGHFLLPAGCWGVRGRGGFRRDPSK